MAEHNDFGKLAEELAATFLEQKGYKILAKNYRYQKAEIDIIAEYEQKIIIVEVKARGIDALLEPYEAVNQRKIKLIVSAADAFLSQGNYDAEVRFDIISVQRKKDNSLEIQHLEDAFDAMDA
ncbi:MAG: YraN family protein [Cruoricaptor ignavus]|nr:YraN family protein [Cruoricaptor ignavus]